MYKIVSDEEVDYDALISFEAKDLLPLLSKVGPRIKFWKKLEAYKATLEVSTKMFFFSFIHYKNLDSNLID